MILSLAYKGNDGKSSKVTAFREDSVWCELSMQELYEDHSRAAGDEPCRTACVKVPEGTDVSSLSEIKGGTVHIAPFKGNTLEGCFLMSLNKY